jgi:serine/threonine protein kinase
LEVGTGDYEKDNGTKKTVSYIVMESAQGGELFDFIAHSGTFTEYEARYFFK